jgi:hypothetical protein
MDSQFLDRIPEWIAIQLYRQRETKDAELTFIEYVRKKNWVLDFTSQEQKVTVTK